MVSSGAKHSQPRFFRADRSHPSELGFFRGLSDEQHSGARGVRLRPSGEKGCCVHFSPRRRQAYNNSEVALDFKLTAASAPFGLNGATMRDYFQRAQKVMLAARAEESRLGQCRVVAFLLRRPACLTFDGRTQRCAFGFVALDADVLCNWDKTSQRPPTCLTTCGSMLQTGTLEPAPLQAAPTRVTSAPRTDRWDQLEQVKRGWVRVQDFALVFKVPPERNLKKATQKLLQRLRKEHCEVVNDERDTTGRPPKVARTRDLQSVWPSD